jgi:hypothetical protein
MKNIIVMILTETLWLLQNMTQRHEVSTMLEKNGTDSLAGQSVVTNLQFVKMQYLQSSIKSSTIKWDAPVVLRGIITASA